MITYRLTLSGVANVCCRVGLGRFAIESAGWPSCMNTYTTFSSSVILNLWVHGAIQISRFNFQSNTMFVPSLCGTLHTSRCNYLQMYSQRGYFLLDLASWTLPAPALVQTPLYWTVIVNTIQRFVAYKQFEVSTYAMFVLS